VLFAIFNKIDVVVFSYYKNGGKSNGAIVSFLTSIFYLIRSFIKRFFLIKTCYFHSGFISKCGTSNFNGKCAKSFAIHMRTHFCYFSKCFIAIIITERDNSTFYSFLLPMVFPIQAIILFFSLNVLFPSIYRNTFFKTIF